MRRATIALLALGAVVVAPVATASPRAAVPKGFTRHVSAPYWTWYAPKDWTASYGANGILISSPSGALFNDYGAGGVPCPSNVTAYLNGVSSVYKNKKALYTKPLRTVRYTSRSKVRSPSYGYFTQRFTWKGTRTNGTAVQGELILDVFAVDAANGVCGQRSQNRGAPAKGFGASLKTLRAVQSLVFYNSQPVARR